MKWQTSLTKIEMEKLLAFQKEYPDCEEYVLVMDNCGGIGTRVTVQGVSHTQGVVERDITDYSCW